MEGSGALRPSLANFRDSCRELLNLHRRQGLVAGINTVFGDSFNLSRLSIGSVNLNLFCHYNITNVNMADAENHISMLPQPRRVGATTMALAELHDQEHNMRSVMSVPAIAGHKRHGSNLPEPAPKRKTLVERAGEPARSLMAAPQSNTVPFSRWPSSFNNYRAASNTSTSSYKTNSTASRQTSASSYSASSGSGIRPPSQALARPKTALAKDRKTADARPKTSHGQREDVEQDVKLKRMGSLSFPSAHTNLAPHNRYSRYLPRKNVMPQAVTKPGVAALPVMPRESSLTMKFVGLSLEPSIPQTPTRRVGSPSRLPKPMTPVPACPTTPHIQKTREKHSSASKFLTKWSNIEALDADEHYSNFKRMFEDYQVLYKQTLGEAHEAKNANNIYTSTIEKLEEERMSKTEAIITLKTENETLKYRLEAVEQARSAEKENEEQKRAMLQTSHSDELRRSKEVSARDLDRVKSDLQKEIEAIKADHKTEMRDLKAKYESHIEEERNQRLQALNHATTQEVVEKQKQALEIEKKEHEITLVKTDLDRVNEMLNRERTLSEDLRKTITDAGSQALSMETTRQALQAKIEFLESDSKSQSEAYADMERRMNAAFLEAEQSLQKLRKEETLRRKLHNQVQELKGNIRVFCRVRPTLPSEEPEELAQMTYPDEEDCKEIEVRGLEEKSSLGKVSTKTYPFAFDRVFNPTSNNSEIFEEISQLIQSALDGYNVCIFAYGQTGSGKTYTMSSEDGMIPKALRQIYTTSKDLEERGWNYTMEGSFVEVYNEELRDLLGSGKEGDGKKHEIRHDMQKCETTITDVVTINLDSQDQVEAILQQAMNKRSVAATSANERSSRSHSVFILKLVGYNSITGEQSKGTLNLVDLAGSERLSHSKVEGLRLKETQSINKSLSCLGDVIGALGQQGTPLSAFDPKASVHGSTSVSGPPTTGGHIPYRNSKLTYLLQFSLGGNSKTLMFVMVAPEKKCLSETLTSLKFADKVSRTRVGVAKKVK